MKHVRKGDGLKAIPNLQSCSRFTQTHPCIDIGRIDVYKRQPDTREGEDEAFGETSNVEVAFWKRMMDEYGTAKKYEASIINRFKDVYKRQAQGGRRADEVRHRRGQSALLARKVGRRRGGRRPLQPILGTGFCVGW